MEERALPRSRRRAEGKRMEEHAYGKKRAERQRINELDCEEGDELKKHEVA
jgi:hypothetical protein